MKCLIKVTNFMNLGFKNCLWCNNEIELKITRDIKRKKYCSYSCRQKHKIETDPRYKQNFQNMIDLGLGHTPEVNAKKGLKGEKNPNYKKDRPQVRTRSRYELTEWRKKVFERDDYTCQHCGKRGGKLNADHIKPYCIYEELRTDLANGRTLCEPCHKKTDTYGAKASKMKRELSNGPL